MNIHRTCLQDYFLSTEDAEDYGKLLAVVRPFDSPIFESRLQSNLDRGHFKKLINEFIYTTLGVEYLDINLPTNKERTYGNVIEDLIALILVANCGVSLSGDPTKPEPHDSATKKALCAAAKSMLIYEMMHIRKFYLRHLMWTIPPEDLSIYNSDYYERYKYRTGRSSPTMSPKQYVEMRHQKKMQHYLSRCEVSWSYVFTGQMQPPENVEDTTRLPMYRVVPSSDPVPLVTSEPFVMLCRHQLPRTHLSAVLPQGFACKHVVEVRPFFEVMQTRSGDKKGNAPSKANAPSAITAPTTATGNVPAQHQHHDVQHGQARSDVTPPIVPNDANAVRFAAWAAKNKTDYETNKQECIKAFHSFPEQYLQLSSDKTKHIELGTVFHRSVDDEIIVVTGRTQMNDCKFQKAVSMGKYPATYLGALTQTLKQMTTFQGLPACHVFDRFPSRMTDCSMYADFTGVCAETQRAEVITSVDIETYCHFLTSIMLPAHPGAKSNNCTSLLHQQAT